MIVYIFERLSVMGRSLANSASVLLCSFHAMLISPSTISVGPNSDDGEDESAKMSAVAAAPSLNILGDGGVTFDMNGSPWTRPLLRRV